MRSPVALFEFRYQPGEFPQVPVDLFMFSMFSDALQGAGIAQYAVIKCQKALLRGFFSR